MRIEEIDREFKELARSLKEAQKAFELGNYPRAQPLYEHALTLLEKSYGEDHSDTCLCIQNLADCYYAQRKYKEAVPFFRRLLIIHEKQHGVNHPDVATALFKLAKTYEKMGMARESESIYRRVLRVGEQVYGPESTFVATALESFAAMLRRNQIRLQEVEQIEERIRDIRERSLTNPGRTTSNIISNLGNINPAVQTGDTDPIDAAMNAKTTEKGAVSSRLRSLRPRADRQTQEDDERPPAGGLLLTQNHVLVALVLIGILVAFGVGVWFCLLPTHNQEEDHVTSAWSTLNQMLKIPSNGPGAQNKAVPAKFKILIFTAPDELKAVTLVDSKHGIIRRGGVDMQCVWMGDVGGIVLTPDRQSITYRFSKTSAGLEDDEQTVLYAPDAPETIVISKMRLLAQAANRYFIQWRQYPKDVEHILPLEKGVVYNNPFNNDRVAPVKRKLFGHDEQSADMSLNDYANMEAATRQLNVWTPAPLSPGIIEFYRCAGGPEGDTFYIRGTDRTGQLLRGSRPGNAFVIQCTQGHVLRR